MISMEISWPEERDRSIAHVGLPSVATGAARRRPEAPPKPPRVYQSADSVGGGPGEAGPADRLRLNSGRSWALLGGAVGKLR